jgi:hypothetical membrane protein
MIKYRVLGVASAIVPYIFIFVSIAESHWFNFFNNALSDLGNYRNIPAAYVYNSGLVITGLMIITYSCLISLYNKKYSFYLWSALLGVSGAFLSLIGVFPENAGAIHGQLSLAFFATIAISLLVYSYISWPVGSPGTGAVSLILGIASVVVWIVHWPWHGVAIQETITSAFAAVWLILTSLFALKSGSPTKV